MNYSICYTLEPDYVFSAMDCTFFLRVDTGLHLFFAPLFALQSNILDFDPSRPLDDECLLNHSHVDSHLIIEHVQKLEPLSYQHLSFLEDLEEDIHFNKVDMIRLSSLAELEEILKKMQVNHAASYDDFDVPLVESQNETLPHLVPFVARHLAPFYRLLEPGLLPPQPELHLP